MIRDPSRTMRLIEVLKSYGLLSHKNKKVRLSAHKLIDVVDLEEGGEREENSNLAEKYISSGESCLSTTYCFRGAGRDTGICIGEGNYWTSFRTGVLKESWRLF